MAVLAFEKQKTPGAVVASFAADQSTAPGVWRAAGGCRCWVVFLPGEYQISATTFSRPAPPFSTVVGNNRTQSI